MARIGLTAQGVVSVACEIADRDGFDRLSLSELAGALGVRVPSLYKHIDGVDDLRARVARNSAIALQEALEESVRDLQGRAALDALVHAFRDWTRRRTGSYQAMLRVGSEGISGGCQDIVGSCLSPPLDRIVIGYGVPGPRRPTLKIVLCSVLRGFVSTDLISPAGRHSEAVREQIVEILHRALSGASRPRTGTRRGAATRRTS